jgi:hypothetical protein
MEITFELFGWVGAGLLLFAYYLGLKKDNETSPYRLPIINLTGSLLLMGNAIFFTVYPFVLINTFWAILSLKELVKLSNTKKNQP